MASRPSRPWPSILPLVLLVLLVIPVATSGAAEPPAAPASAARPPDESHPAAPAALAAQCDDLLASAVRTPFGWGWTSADAEAAALRGEAAQPNRARPAARAGPHKPAPIDSAETAVLGLELYRAGQALHEPKYEEAAFEAARAVCTLQTRTGQFRSRGAPGGAGREEAGDVPDRAPTRAALALLLTLIEADRPVPPADAAAVGPAGAVADAPSAGAGEGRRWAQQLKGPAAHAAYWLAAQQSPSGAWPAAYPPDAPFGKGYRLIRLDSPDYRDNLCTLLLAGEVLDDANLRRLADHAADGLLALRVPNWPAGARGLWVSANTLEGEAPRKFPELNRGYDLLASRYAMQAMLATYLLTLQAKGDEALSDAARALAALPREGDKWVRFYDRRGQLASALPTTQPGGAFSQDAAAADDGSAAAFGLPPVLDALTQIHAVGGKKYADFLAATRPINARLAEQVCGLSDDALGLRLPGGAEGNVETGDPKTTGRPNGSAPSDKPAGAAAGGAVGPSQAAAPGISDRTLRLWTLLQKTTTKTDPH